VALASGDLVRLGGGKASETTGYDLTGLFTGSEGTMGIVTRIWVRLTPLPPMQKTLLAIYPDIETASNGVSAIVENGILPAAIEMLDKISIQAIEAASHAGYPLDAGAVLLLEVDGIEPVVEDLGRRMADICRKQGATEVRVAQNEAERQALWKGRKGAFSAMGRLSPDFHVMDGVVPRTKLPETLEKIDAISKRAQLEARAPDSPVDMDPEETRVSVAKLRAIAVRERAALIVFGHDAEQWRTLRKAPEFYA